VFAGDGQTLKGYEALARWPHPTRGMVPPAVFIPVAEDSGQIVELGRWVLASACAEARRWPEPLSVAVNLSTAQFAQGLDVVQDVRDALHKSGLPGHRLELEITESLLMHHTDEVLAILHALRALDVRIAMDDFGTGYSSLAYLWRFPFDKLKIDRAFTQGLSVDQRVDVIVRSIVRLAHSLSIRVNAEGVETEEQRNALHQMGCDELQGYLLGRPSPAERLLHVEQEVVAIVVPDVELA
jgi:EAL domain-containing protein (putative c-di-GMP-specific phosphodiesterase class I)